jgi:hypothetical protein
MDFISILSNLDLAEKILETCDLRDLCSLKMLGNKKIYDIISVIYQEKYENEILHNFQIEKEKIFNLLYGNYLFLTINDYASIYFEFLNKFSYVYEAVFVHDKLIIESTFHFVVLCYPFLINKDEIGIQKTLSILRKHLCLKDFTKQTVKELKNYAKIIYPKRTKWIRSLRKQELKDVLFFPSRVSLKIKNVLVE